MEHMLPDSNYLPVYTPLGKSGFICQLQLNLVQEKRTPYSQVPINSEKIESQVEKSYSLSVFLEDTTAALLDAPH